MTGSGINGLSVGIITVGGVLVYAGIRGVSPLQALRDVSSGKPKPIPNVPGQVDLASGNVASNGQRTTGASALAAAAANDADKYSQLRRHQPGYSDCSSYVDKGFHAIGIDKPDGTMPWPNTSAFAVSPAWKTIPQSQTMPGDIAVVTAAVTGRGHMVFVTAPGASQGKGQQNPRSNVRTGTMAELFSGVSGTIIYRTYVGTG